MANQLVQYGATVAGAVVVGSAAGAISTAISNAPKTFTVLDDVYGASTVTSGSWSNAIDAGTASFTSSLSSTFTNPAFLMGAGIGLLGAKLGTGSLRPSLSLPNLVATAAVALNAGKLLQQGQAAISAAGARRTGGMSVSPINFSTMPAADVSSLTSTTRSRGQAATYNFPLNNNQQYWIKLSLRQYNRKSAQDTTTPGNFHTIIKLPLPSTILDAISITYQDLSLGMFGGRVLEGINDAMDTYKSAGGSFANKAGATAGSVYKSMTSLLADEQFAYAVGRRLLQGTQFGSAADLLTGTIPNPHMAVTFQGVNLKKHSFTWRLSPDSLSESHQLEKIIKQLQAASLPGTEGNNALLLTFPDTVMVEMQPSNLMTFKPCAIDSISVNYAPNGVPSFFRGLDNSDGSFDRYPTDIELTLTLRELDMHTADMEWYSSTKEAQNETQKMLNNGTTYATATPDSA
jgi:hypothetical protein